LKILEKALKGREGLDNTLGVAMKKVLIGLMCLFFLVGCGPTLRMRAWKELKESKAIYKECLMRQPENLKKCEGLR